MDFGKFRFCGCALQYAEMRADRNRPHLQLPLFLLTCHTGICIGGAQKQSLPKLFVSNPFFVQAGHGLDPLESNMRIFSSRWLMWWTYAAQSSGGIALSMTGAKPPQTHASLKCLSVFALCPCFLQIPGTGPVRWCSPAGVAEPFFARKEAFPQLRPGAARDEPEAGSPLLLGSQRLPRHRHRLSRLTPPYSLLRSLTFVRQKPLPGGSSDASAVPPLLQVAA